MKLFLTFALLAFVTVPAAVAAGGGTIVMIFGQSDFAAGVDVGWEVDVILQTNGPGEYAAPPVVSSKSLRYLGVFNVGPPTPGGARQLFRFKAVKPGPVTATFSQVETARPEDAKSIADTFDVH